MVACAKQIYYIYYLFRPVFFSIEVCCDFLCVWWVYSTFLSECKCRGFFFNKFISIYLLIHVQNKNITFKAGRNDFEMMHIEDGKNWEHAAWQLNKLAIALMCKLDNRICSRTNADIYDLHNDREWLNRMWSRCRVLDSAIAVSKDWPNQIRIFLECFVECVYLLAGIVSQKAMVYSVSGHAADSSIFSLSE